MIKEIKIGETIIVLETNNMNQAKLVYGTRSNRWHAVGESDRDYRTALTFDEFKALGEAASKEKYLMPSGI